MRLEKNEAGLYEDHEGRTFKTTKEMACHWGVCLATLKHRVEKQDMPLAQALTAPSRTRKPCYDHNGKEYSSMRTLAKAYGINRMTLAGRIRDGMPLDKALAEQDMANNQPCRDHTGQAFPSISAMCRKWGLKPYAYYHRIAAGMTLEQALTTPVGNSRTDHLGNTFKSQAEMLRHWNVSNSTFCRRLRQGMSLKDALERDDRNLQPCTDSLGNRFPSVQTMGEYWFCSNSAIKICRDGTMGYDKAWTKACRKEREGVRIIGTYGDCFLVEGENGETFMLTGPGMHTLLCRRALERAGIEYTGDPRGAWLGHVLSRHAPGKDAGPAPAGTDIRATPQQSP